jgi:hypothetical protein
MIVLRGVGDPHRGASPEERQMTESQSGQELRREQVDDDVIRFHVGDRHYHVQVVRTYLLHGHFGTFTSLDQIETVIRKIEEDR